MQKKAYEDLVAEVQELRAQLEEAQETLNAIRRGEVDGLVVSTPKGEHVYTMTGAEKPYRDLIEDMREGAVMLSDDNTVLYCNIGFAKMMMRPMEKIVGNNIESMVFPTYIPVLTKLLSLARGRKSAVTKEVTLQARDNFLVPTLMSVKSLKSDTLNNTFLVVTDLTEHMEEDLKRYTNKLETEIIQRKKAEDSLRKQALIIAQNAELARQRVEELEKLMDIIPAAVWVSRDPQCKNIIGNQAANNFYEASVGENVSAGQAEGSAKNSTRRFFQGNKELTPQELPMQKAAAKNVEIRNSELDVLLPSNRKITILGNAKPLLDYKGEVRGCLAVFMDLTERKQAEDALKENEQLFRTVFDNSQDGFQLIELIHDENGKPIDHKFLKVNQAYKKIIGVKSDDFLGKTARHISPNVEPHWLDIPDRVSKTGISAHVELYNKDIGKWLDCFYFFYSKNVVGTLFRDITGRKKLEKQLQDSERLAVIGATAGMVGHDIRNPLQAITSDLYLIKSDLDSAPECIKKDSMKESLAGIESNVEYIDKIVADLQDYARAIAPAAQEVDIGTLCEEVLFKNGIPENIQASYRVAPEASILISDLTLLKRMLNNLTINSVQAMPKGGKLTIEAYKTAGDFVIIVEDTGVGIANEMKEKLFTPMFTTKSKGQGFGLAVVKRMAEALGGSVTFESEVGKGTKFTIRFPSPKELNGKWTYKQGLDF